MRFPLRWKILTLVVAAPLLLAAGSLKLVNERVSKTVRTNLDEDLHRASLVCRNFLEARGTMLEASSRVIVQDPRFFAVLSLPGNARDSQLRATVDGVARDFNEIAQAEIFDVLDSSGRPLASVGKTGSTAPGRAPLIRALGKGEPVPRFLSVNGHLYLATLTPVRAGNRRVGMLLLGTPIDDALAGELRDMTRSEVTFLSAAGPSGTTLTDRKDLGALREALAAAEPSPPDAPEAVFSLRTGPTTYLTLARALPGASAGSRDVFVLQRSLRAETAFLREIQGGMTEFVLLVLIVTGSLGLIVSQTITRPIQALVRGAEEIEKGNYDHPLRATSRDEIGYLTRRFEDMREHERAYIRNLQEVARLKSTFIDVASHELRTPATVVKGFTELLADGTLGPLSDRQREAVDGIDRSLQAILQISENATWMAKLTGDPPALERSVVLIASLLEDAVRTVREEAAGRKVELEVAAEDPELHGDVDPSRLVQAVAHLLRNGIRFTPDGGSVAAAASAHGADLEIAVTDTGVGMSPDACERIFDRSLLIRDVLHHHSSSGLAFQSTGMGLGLAIARGIAEAHGGTLAVESREGQGSTFTLRLPGAAAPGTAKAA